jgi:protein phosphatase
MGGHMAGEVASRLAVETVLTEYYADTGEPQQNLLIAIQKANEHVYVAAKEDPEREGMGCTIVACVIVGDRAIIAHVGDSRAYQIHNGILQLLTKDHLHLTENLGRSAEEVKQHHLRHMLSRALGISREVQVDVAICPWEPGDRFLLCSDGLSNAVPESEILMALSQPTSREAVAELLQLAEEHKADDNSSAIVVHLVPEDMQPLANSDATVAGPTVPIPQPQEKVGVDDMAPENNAVGVCQIEASELLIPTVSDSSVTEDEPPVKESILATPSCEDSIDPTVTRFSWLRRWQRFLYRRCS